jgi:hypothetical protein
MIQRFPNLGAQFLYGEGLLDEIPEIEANRSSSGKGLLHCMHRIGLNPRYRGFSSV